MPLDSSYVRQSPPVPVSDECSMHAMAVNAGQRLAMPSNGWQCRPKGGNGQLPPSDLLSVKSSPARRPPARPDPGQGPGQFS